MVTGIAEQRLIDRASGMRCWRDPAAPFFPEAFMAGSTSFVDIALTRRAC
jgi:hypothetical protein